MHGHLFLCLVTILVYHRYSDGCSLVETSRAPGVVPLLEVLCSEVHTLPKNPGIYTIWLIVEALDEAKSEWV